LAPAHVPEAHGQGVFGVVVRTTEDLQEVAVPGARVSAGCCLDQEWHPAGQSVTDERGGFALACSVNSRPASPRGVARHRIVVRVWDGGSAWRGG